MADLKLSDLKSQMIEGARGVVLDGWPQIKEFANTEMKLLAQSLVEIKNLFVKGKITRAEAKSLIRQHKNTTAAVLAGIEGMTLLLAEQAVNAALKAVRDAVNTAAGVILI